MYRFHDVRVIFILRYYYNNKKIYNIVANALYMIIHFRIDKNLKYEFIRKLKMNSKINFFYPSMLVVKFCL